MAGRRLVESPGDLVCGHARAQFLICSAGYSSIRSLSSSDAEVGHNQLTGGPVSRLAEDVVFYLDDGRKIHAKLFPVQIEGNVPFKIYVAPIRHAQVGEVIAYDADHRELARAGFSVP
jgi:hypothetical protein